MLRILVYRSYSSAWHRFQAIHKRNNTEYGDANNTLKILGPKRSELSSIGLGLHHLHCWKGSNLEYPLNVEFYPLPSFGSHDCWAFTLVQRGEKGWVHVSMTAWLMLTAFFYFMRPVTIHLQWRCLWWHMSTRYLQQMGVIKLQQLPSWANSTIIEFAKGREYSKILHEDPQPKQNIQNITKWMKITNQFKEIPNQKLFFQNQCMQHCTLQRLLLCPTMQSSEMSPESPVKSPFGRTRT